jgi:hypothetical protein
MRGPVMQQEWQRRQTQRSVWALVGLLALLAPASTTVAGGLPASPPRLGAVAATETCDACAVRTGTPPGRAAARSRYWRELAAQADGRARVRLERHAVARPTVDSRDLYLRRCLRPPTA